MKNKISVGDRFSYGNGKGVWAVTDILPFGRVYLMDHIKATQTERYQKDIRSALERGVYKQIEDDSQQLAEVFEKAPLSERTLRKHHFMVGCAYFKNDEGHPCEYRIVLTSGRDIGMIKYFHGRKLAAYEISSI